MHFGFVFRIDFHAHGLTREILMKGVQFLVDEDGNKTAVLIDLKRNAELWENFYDLALARARKSEPRESLESVKRRLRTAKSRTNG
jgi:hypothetical protein